MKLRHRNLPQTLPVTAVVLAPTTFYTAAGARTLAVKPTLELIGALRDQLAIDLRLAVWDKARRMIGDTTWRPDVRPEHG